MASPRRKKAPAATDPAASGSPADAEAAAADEGARPTKAAAAASAVDEELSRCIIELLMKEPFYGHFLGGVVRSVTKATPTAAVGLRGAGVHLMVNPSFFMKELKKRTERVAVVKHETLHLVLKHLFRLDRNKHQGRLYNIAADLVVNQLIDKYWRLPESAVTLATFPDLGLEPDQTLDWYYERLARLQREMDRGGEGSAPKSAAALAGLERWHSDHDPWAEAAGSVEAGVASGDVDRLLARTADRVGPKVWGTLPGPLRAMIAAALEQRRPQVDWRRALRIFASSARRTRIVATNTRQSRRYGSFPGIKVKRLQRMAVAIDTSGSVGDEALSVFFGEIHSMWQKGAEIVVIECDAAVQRTYTYRGKLPDAVAGRGGTAFEPVFQHLRADRTQTWDGCIYLTDGAGPAPTTRPPCRVLWVVTADGSTGEHLRFGRTVKLAAP